MSEARAHPKNRTEVQGVEENASAHAWVRRHLGGESHRVVEAGFVAELAVGSGVDQHLAAGGGGAVRDDLGVQVHVALVERRQRRTCAEHKPAKHQRNIAGP